MKLPSAMCLIYNDAKWGREFLFAGTGYVICGFVLGSTEYFKALLAFSIVFD